ncbi:MAG: DUF3071 domain-containing protein [Actinomycetaceae bacterium]|nr:DUF3071 domain-containing protein [Actinomycetaceae bacterium]
MKTLELLGLQPDGQYLSFTDQEGNRYRTRVNEDLRAVLRQDQSSNDVAIQPKNITPREIQGYIREGKTIDEVSKIASIPPSYIEPLAHPIFEERQYTARTARNFKTSKEHQAPTLEKLALSRLKNREINAEDISWDAVRKKGTPWTLILTFTTASRTHKASWNVDMSNKTLAPLDDEAIWLSETELITTPQAWRQAHTPSIDNTEEVHLPPVPAPVPRPALDHSSLEKNTRIDSLLDSLDEHRGQPHSMPTYNDETQEDSLIVHNAFSLDPLDAHTSVSQDPPPRINILEKIDTPTYTEEERISALETPSVSIPTLSTVESSTPEPEKKKKTPARTSVPTWDEIVFGTASH